MTGWGPDVSWVRVRDASTISLADPDVCREWPMHQLSRNCQPLTSLTALKDHGRSVWRRGVCRGHAVEQMKEKRKKWCCLGSHTFCSLWVAGRLEIEASLCRIALCFVEHNFVYCGMFGDAIQVELAFAVIAKVVYWEFGSELYQLMVYPKYLKLL